MILRWLLGALFIWSGTAEAKNRAYAVFGDGGDWNAKTQQVEKSIRGQGIFHAILVGDNLYQGTYAAAWDPWFRAGFRFPVVALGNHTAGYEEEMRFFDMPAEAYTTYLGRGIAAIVLNSDNVATARRQAKFLERELRSLDAQSIFVIFHHPSLSVTANHPWTERREFHEAVRPVLYRYRKRISAVLSGHDHVAAAFSFGDLPVIVSGAIKDTMKYRPMNGRQEGIQVKTEWAYRGRPTWAKLVVADHSDKSTIEFVEAEGSRTLCRVRIKTGEWLFLEDSCYRTFRPGPRR